MLRINVPEIELFNSETEEITTIKPFLLSLEHSLVSVAKWEAKWHKAFLERNEKTDEELRDYIRCMTLTQNVNPEFYDYIPRDIVETIERYIDDPMTATTIRDKRNKPAGHQIVTNELIYWWMIQLNIPFECQKWHLNHLLTLIKVCEAKSNPTKMNRKDIYSQNAKLNAMRRKTMKSRG